MRRPLLAALAACFLTTAWADEKPRGPAEKTPEARAGGQKATGARRDRREGGASSKGETPGKAAPEKQKPCEVVRPCPID